jgi:LPS sulfotransferase NodH
MFLTKEDNMEISQKTRGFAIYFLARSGSTYIIHRLRNHPFIVARAEVFGASTLPNNLAQTSDNQIAFLRKFWRPYHKSSAVDSNISRGFKVQITTQNPQLISISRYAKVVNEYDVCHFFLHRRNQVKQLVSSYRAAQIKDLTLQKTGQSFGHIYRDKFDSKNLELPKIKIDPNEFKFRLSSIEKKLKVIR